MTPQEIIEANALLGNLTGGEFIEANNGVGAHWQFSGPDKPYQKEIHWALGFHRDWNMLHLAWEKLKGQPGTDNIGEAILKNDCMTVFELMTDLIKTKQ